MCLSPFAGCRALLRVFGPRPFGDFPVLVPHQRRRPPSMSLSEGPSCEESLIQKCLSGNKDAWTELFERYNSHLRAAARRTLGTAARNEDDAEHAVAEVWVFLCEHPERLAEWDPGREDPCAFLSKLVRNR